MADQPQQGKIGVEFAAHDGGQVEFHISRAAQAGVVVHQAQLQPIGEDGPGVVDAAVEELLHQAVGSAFERASALAAPVQRLAKAHQVDGRLFPQVADGVGCPVVALQPAALKLQATKAQFLKEHQQPAFARQRHAAVVRGQPAPLLIEAQPGAQAAIPRPVDGLVEALARQQVVVLRAQPLDCAAIGDALEQVGGQQAALGLDGGKGGAGDGLHNSSHPRFFAGAQNDKPEASPVILSAAKELFRSARFFAGAQNDKPEASPVILSAAKELFRSARFFAGAQNDDCRRDSSLRSE